MATFASNISPAYGNYVGNFFNLDSPETGKTYYMPGSTFIVPFGGLFSALRLPLNEIKFIYACVITVDRALGYKRRENIPYNRQEILAYLFLYDYMFGK